MILEQGKAAEVILDGVDESINMGIDAGSTAVLMNILSQGLYKDPIGSIVREWTSNALDSHVEAGVDEPVIVAIQKDDTYNWWFSVQDFGVGISPDRLENIISKYAASTKRNTNTMLGAFGLGLKSGLSYSDSFIFSTNYNGLETVYTMYKGEEGTKIDKLSEKPTTERNGSTFKIQIKGFYDKAEFIRKCTQQLCYFEKVYFDCGTDIVNERLEITKNPLWKHSTFSNDKYLHLSLDNVYYSLDYNRLGIDPVMIPIALCFNIGEGLQPTPPREDIMYTPTAKQLIKDRIKQVANYFVEKYNETVTEAEDIWTALKNIDPKQYEYNDFLIVQLEALKKHSSIEIKKPTVKGIVHNSLKQINEAIEHMYSPYQVRGQISNGRFNSKTVFSVNLNNTKRILESPELKKTSTNKYIRVKEKPNNIVIDYIKWLYPNDDVYFVYLDRARKLGKPKRSYSGTYYLNTVDYRPLLNLDKFPKDTWRDRIIEFQSIEEKAAEVFYNIEEFVPSEEYLTYRKSMRKTASKTYVKKAEVRLNWGKHSDKADAGAIFKDKEIDFVSDLHKRKHLTVYAVAGQEADLGQISCYKHIKTCLFSERDYTKMKNETIHNWITIEKFMEGKTQPFKRLATALRIAKLRNTYYNVFNNYSEIALFSRELSNKLELVYKYWKKYHPYSIGEDAENAILSVAEEHNYWDNAVISELEELERLMPQISFIGHITINSSTRPVIIDVLKYRKIKLNLEHYGTKTAEEQKQESNEDEDFDLELEEENLETEQI
jgi:hypothetical protein